MIGLFLILLFSGAVIVAQSWCWTEVWRREAFRWKAEAMKLQRELKRRELRLDSHEHLERN